MMSLKKTNTVNAGGLLIGGGNPISVQSMLNASSEDIKGNILQAIALEKAGCDIIRVALPTIESVYLIEKIKKNIAIPLVADIHFDYKIALSAIEHGIDKIRINPGNIGDKSKIYAVAKAAREKCIPIRIGVNAGSLEKSLLVKYQHPTAEALVESAMYHAELLNQADFKDIVISLKSSNVALMLKAYRLASEKMDYPLHLGVTEAGSKYMGVIKSAIGIGSLLADGIGDTIRVSLTADPIEEIMPARDIIKAAGRDKNSVNIVSCPTCGRTRIDIISLTEKVEKAVSNIKKGITVAVMGCVVNGPGEAKEADIGIAGGNGEGLIFIKGEIVEKVPEDKLLERLLYYIEKL